VAAVALGLAGAVDAARQADRQLEQAGANLVMVRDALRPMVAAAILLGERRPEEALRELDRLRPFETARELESPNPSPSSRTRSRPPSPCSRATRRGSRARNRLKSSEATHFTQN
jgi:hypothetical protein